MANKSYTIKQAKLRWLGHIERKMREVYVIRKYINVIGIQREEAQCCQPI